jgi:hypothetical protein
VLLTCPTVLSPLGWVAASTIRSSRLPDSTPTSKASLASLAEWLDTTGTPTVMRAPVAEALGFANADLPVRERGFRGKGEQLTHVGSVIAIPGYNDVVFFALVDESTGNATVWRAHRSGDLVASVIFVNGEATTNPDQQTREPFIAEKDYLLRQMRDRLFRASPPNSPSCASPMPKAALTTMPEAATSLPSRKTALPSELTVLFAAPWVLPAIALILVLGVYRGDRHR